MTGHNQHMRKEAAARAAEGRVLVRALLGSSGVGLAPHERHERLARLFIELAAHGFSPQRMTKAAFQCLALASDIRCANAGGGAGAEPAR